MGIKKTIKNISVKIGLAIAKRMSPIIKDAIDNPENLKFEGRLEGDEFVIRIKRIEESK